MIHDPEDPGPAEIARLTARYESGEFADPPTCPRCGEYVTERRERDRFGSRYVVACEPCGVEAWSADGYGPAFRAFCAELPE